MASTINSTGTTSSLSISGDTSGALALQTNSTTAVTIDVSQKVGIGTSSPREKLEVAGAIIATSGLSALDSSTMSMDFSASQGRLIATGADSSTYAPLIFGNATTSTFAERMRIDSSGYTYINTTTLLNNCRLSVAFNGATGNSIGCQNTDTGSSSQNVVFFYRNGTGTGTISHTNSATAYNTSSDYRLKENVQPMTGALNKVAQLKPVTFNWISSQNSDNGFIAHELQEICPNAVNGEKDAVDEEGKPVYQGVDASFLVATLTAAIQEQQALITNLTTRLAALEGAK